ncbi:MAG: hypothetical protein J6K32_00320 [Clostridia bacterium]|nr:hypothetical protein [Clostridia bacterium]
MDHRLYHVYIRPDGFGRVLDVNSSAFLRDTQGYMRIDSGYGPRYHHAQGRYFPLPLYDMRGVCRYETDRLADIPAGLPLFCSFTYEGEPWAVYERTAEEMDADADARPAPPPSLGDRLAALEQAGLERDAALIELAALLGGGE